MLGKEELENELGFRITDEEFQRLEKECWDVLHGHREVYDRRAYFKEVGDRLKYSR